MKTEDYSDFCNEFAVIKRPATEVPTVDSLGGDIDIRVKSTEWARFCLRHRALEDTPEIDCARFELPQVDKPTELRAAVKFSRGKQMSCTLFYVSFDHFEPLSITSHYNRAVESLREAYCLLVPMSEDVVWAPNIWPVSIEELNNFVARMTDSPKYLEAWVMQRSSQSNQLLVVVVIKGNVCYGYLLGSPKLAGFSKLRIVPIFFDHVGQFEPECRVMVELELSVKNLEELLKHARQLQPESGDVQEDRRLRDALDMLANALEKGASRSRKT